MRELETANLLKDRVVYDEASGELYWAEKVGTSKEVRRWNAAFCGKKAGGDTGEGYLRIRVKLLDGTEVGILNHRLVWYLKHGTLPEFFIDHVNRNRGDNRIENLRDVTKSVNSRNTKLRTDNTSGYVGVSLGRNDKWVVQISDNSKRRSYKRFPSKEAAMRAARAFQKLLGYSDSHGGSSE